MTAGVAGIGLAFGGSQPVAFGVEHDDSVRVRMGNGDPFLMEVVDRTTDEVLEARAIVSPDSLFQLDSSYASFYRIDPPGS
jgi:hypothetical protein